MRSAVWRWGAALAFGSFALVVAAIDVGVYADHGATNKGDRLRPEVKVACGDVMLVDAGKTCTDLSSTRRVAQYETIAETGDGITVLKRVKISE